ncbi:MAG: hypothetical protein HOP08_07015 [Cyclobacteriaceae bacterium]|nr:hypothetical protein [Cyclobacteriaceae bacterium]
MKNRIKILFILIMITFSSAFAQEFKLAKSTGRLEINIGRATIQGYDGNEIIFTSADYEKDKDERAKGLKEINSLGLDDNTGLGINVTSTGEVVTVRQLKKTNSPKIKIQVPKGMIISYSHESQYGGEVSFRNLENEIEVSVQYNSVELENCNGPVTIKTIYGHVEGVFEPTTKGPISIVSVYGYVDVSIPTATKANLKLSTSHGQIYVAPDFKIDINKQGDMVRYSDNLNGKINGGGMNVDLNCSYGKVYLRKK